MSDRDPGELERLLESVRFEPRASLGAELLGRHRRGERPPGAPRRRFRLLAAGVVLGAGVLGTWAAGGLRPGGLVTVDRCCQDLDGGGEADDGILVVTRRGSAVRRLAIYEDRDRSRSFTPGDPVRFERGGEVTLAGPLAPAQAAREFCCLDYDGGGPQDDALVVVGVAPDRIHMAAIYERGGAPGTSVKLR